MSKLRGQVLHLRGEHATDPAEPRGSRCWPLPEQPLDPRDVVAALAAAAEPGLVASSSGRFFGRLDENAGLYVLAPAASVAEQVAAGRLAELLGLPAGVSVGFVTGARRPFGGGDPPLRHRMTGRPTRDPDPF